MDSAASHQFILKQIWHSNHTFLFLVCSQAHVRGYQARKKYEVICWAVGVLEKAVLRWRRKEGGLRGFKPETECIDEDEDDEDIIRVYRKKKVNVAIDEAVSRVLTMVECPEAREQYHRVLGKYQEAKVIVLQSSIRLFNYALFPHDAYGKFSIGDFAIKFYSQ